MAKDAGEIRVIKRKKSHGGHHGGAWKVAYADFVTAMMAFFLVMWIVGLSEDVKNSVAGYFKDPIAFMDGARKGETPFTVSGSGMKQELDRHAMEQLEQDVAKLGQAKKRIEKMVADVPELKNIKDSVDIKLVEEGLKIDLVEDKEALFFDSASAAIKPQTRVLLKRIGLELRKLPNTIIIEGHTDSRRMARRDGYTNWELSADRANSARRVLETAGLRAKQIEHVRGYADTRPRDPANPANPVNRRVSIIVVRGGALLQPQTPSDSPSAERRNPKA